MRFIISLIAILNILAGAILAMIIIMMQGIPLFLFGLIYSLFGILLLFEILVLPVLFCGIIPITLIYIFQITMMVLSKNVPVQYQVSPKMGLMLTLPFILLCLVNSVIFTRPKVRNQIKYDWGRT